MSLGALGVVFGDIATSPLYAMNEMFFGHAHLSRNPQTVIGAISVVFWALTIIISFKYVLFVLRADNKGEGGVFALMGLLKQKRLGWYWFMIPVLTFAAGLLFGDGIITPAISVISAVEGLKLAAPQLDSFIVPITILILTGLFSIQRNGTEKVGKFFGPVVVTWLLAISCIGIMHIVRYPSILQAVNPLAAVQFFAQQGFHKILILMGSVMLVVTGGEALYADMGHFGKNPIRLSWFSLVYPALLFSYFGQGAYLLSGSNIQGNNIFFSMVPQPLLIPMILLATCATVIASQALISGVFSLTSQAVSMGVLPYMEIVQTHEDHEGQRYIPFINWALFIGCVLLVLGFQSSTNLAGAYGLAVSGDMLITTIALAGVAFFYWRWKIWGIILFFAPLAVLDIVFLTSNSLKIFAGGYIPLSIGALMFIAMRIWQWGRKHVKHAFGQYERMSVGELIEEKKQQTEFIPRSMIVLSPDTIDEHSDDVPMLKQLFWDRYGILPKHLIFLTVISENSPYIPDQERYNVYPLFEDEKKGSIVSVELHFGFMEERNVERMLERLAKDHLVHIDLESEKWLVHALHERISLRSGSSIAKILAYNIFRVMSRISMSADQYFHLGRKVGLSLEIYPVKI